MNINFNDLHKAFENRIRLGIMSILAANDQVDFNSLKDYLAVTDGNLASHLKYLEKEGFITIEKRFIDRKPNTNYSCSKKGKQALMNHLNTLELIIKSQKD